MNETELRIYVLKEEIRNAVNRAGMPYGVIESVLDAIKSEVLIAEKAEYMNTLMTEKAEGETDSGLHEDNVGE